MTTKNSIAAANEKAWRDLIHEVDHNARPDFDMGWDAALEFARPLIQVLSQTLQVLDATGMLDEGGRLIMRAAGNFLELVPATTQERRDDLRSRPAT